MTDDRDMRDVPLHVSRRSLLERARRAVADRFHDLDDRVSRQRGRRRRLLFEAANPMLFNVFAPVYDRLRQDRRIEITLMAHGEEWAPQEIFAGADSRIVSPTAGAWMKPDVYVNTDFWSMTWLLRRTRRVHLFHGVAGKLGLDAPLDVARTVRSFDRILFPNRDRLKRYVDAGLVVEGSRVATLVGYPKVDCLIDGSLDRDAIGRQLAFTNAAPTVIYAPTWSAHSSLNTAGENIIEALSSAGFNLIVKLHTCSYKPRGSGGVDWQARLARFERRQNVRIVREPDASPYLFAADALVTDHSTVAFEFMLLDRPIVVVDSPSLVTHARINPQKVALLHEAAEVVQSAAELPGAIRRGLSDPRRLSGERRRIGRELFYRPGTATTRAVEVIYEELALTAPAAATADNGIPAGAHASTF